MKLICDLLKWLLSKTFLIAVLTVIIFLVNFSFNWLAKQNISANHIKEIEINIHNTKKTFLGKIDEIKNLDRSLKNLKKEEPPRYYLLDHYKWNKKYEALSKLKKVSSEKSKILQQKIDSDNYDLKSANEGLHPFIKTWNDNGIKIIIIAIAVLIGPLVLKIIWYYLIARMARISHEIQIVPSNKKGFSTPLKEEKLLEVPLTPNSPLIARMDWVQQYCPDANKKTRFLWSWKSPFISYASGLKEMTEIWINKQVENSKVVLGSGDNPDNYVICLELENHPGFVIKPNQIVAISGNIQIKTKWTLKNIHSWVSGKLRHIIVYGTGKIYLLGYGGLECIDNNNQSIRVEESLILGYDCRKLFSTVRTETFWPFFRGMTSLFDYQFSGPGYVIRQNAMPNNQRNSDNPLMKTIDAILNGIGKVFGF